MSMRSDIRALPGSAWILFAGALVNRFGSFVLIFLVLYLKAQGYTITQIGFIMSAYGVGGISAAAVGGYLADTFGRRNTIALSMFLSAGAMVGLSQAHTLGTLIGLTAVAGLTTELYRPAASALLTDLTVPGQRVTAFAVYRLAINLGMAIGPAVGGLLADRSFLYIFIGDAATSIVFGIVALTLLPNRTVAHHGAQQAVGVARGVRLILRDTYFVLFIIAWTIGAFVYMQGHTTLPLQIDAYGFSPKIFGMLISVNGLLVMLIELPLTSITRRHRPQNVMFVGFVLTGIGFGLTGLVSTLPLLVMSVAVWTLGEIVLVPVAAAHVANIAPIHMRGRYQGAFGMSWGVGLVLAPIIGGQMFVRDAQALWLVCFGLCVAAGLIVAMARRPHDQ